MSSSFNLLFLVFVFTFMFALAKPTPIKDVPSFIQSVDSKEITSTTFETNERFIIPFKRIAEEGVDEVIVDDAIKFEGTSGIIIDLKIENDELIINSLPLKLGTTSVQVIGAKVILADISNEEIDNYMDNYDEALITVKISSSIDSVQTIGNLIINRITISITAMEVDGVQIVQVKVIEKILEIESSSPNESGNQLIKQHRHRHHSPCKGRLAQLKARLHHWWRCSSRYTRILLTSSLLTFIFAIFFITARSISNKKHLSTNAYQQHIPNYFYNDKESFERVIFIADEEKRVLMEEYQ